MRYIPPFISLVGAALLWVGRRRGQDPLVRAGLALILVGAVWMTARYVLD